MVDDEGRRQQRGEKIPHLEVEARALTSISSLRSTIDQATDGLLSVHRAGSVVTYNRRFLELWRIPATYAARADNAQLISFVLDQLVDPGTFLRITRENQADPRREYFSLIRFRDGRIVERFSRPRYAGNEIAGRLLSFRDVTERERLLEHAYEAIHTREELVRTIADTVPLPVAALSLAVQSLLEGAPPASAAPPALDFSARDQPHLAWLFQQLVDLGRIRAGTLPLSLEPVDLVEVARTVIARYAPEIARSGSDVRLRAHTPVVGTWNLPALDQVVSNLLSNAIRFGRGNPIEMRVWERADRAVLTVIDGGIGISGEVRHRLFVPPDFVRLAREGGGGLGLYVVRTVVEAFGGTVHVEARPNAGTTFEIELPRGTASSWCP